MRWVSARVTLARPLDAGALEDGRARHPERARTEGQVMIGMISSATMFATLIIGLIAGPAVSL